MSLEQTVFEAEKTGVITPREAENIYFFMRLREDGHYWLESFSIPPDLPLMVRHMERPKSEIVKALVAFEKLLKSD